MTLSVLSIMGIALTRILISDTRFVSRQDAMLSARQGARAALNALLAELEMVADTIVFATRDSLQARVPVAFGIACRAASGSTRIVSFLPVDSVAWASLDSTGILTRQVTGGYKRTNFTSIAATSTASDSGQCKADSVRMLPGGRLIKLSGLTNTSCSVASPPATCQPDSLSIAMLYSRITYKFAPSTDLPGRIGLWRRTWTGTAEELVTPFDTSARFAYLMGGPSTTDLAVRTANVTGAAGLDSVRGVELRLFAASVKAPQGTKLPQVFPLRTRVRFANRVSQ